MASCELTGIAICRRRKTTARACSTPNITPTSAPAPRPLHRDLSSRARSCAATTCDCSFPTGPRATIRRWSAAAPPCCRRSKRAARRNRKRWCCPAWRDLHRRDRRQTAERGGARVCRGCRQRPARGGLDVAGVGAGSGTPRTAHRARRAPGRRRRRTATATLSNRVLALRHDQDQRDSADQGSARWRVASGSIAAPATARGVLSIRALAGSGEASCTCAHIASSARYA